MSATENLRYHAAGHLAAAHGLVRSNYCDAARSVLETVKIFAVNERVNAPPILLEKLQKCIEQPTVSLNEIALLEEWFCNPLNTIIEDSGGFRA